MGYNARQFLAKSLCAMLKKETMRIILTTILISILFASNIYGQITDSTEVKQITYTSNSNTGKTVMVTEQQMKAKPDYEKGYSLVGNHEFKKAIDPLKKAIEIDSTGNCGTGKNGMAFSELGYAYTRLGDFDNAISYLDRAIEINKLVPEPYLSKSVILMQQGNNELALQTLDSLIKFIPEYAIAYIQRGFLYNSTKKYELALQDFNKYLEIVKEQNQEQNSRALVEDIKKQIKELEKKVEK